MNPDLQPKMTELQATLCPLSLSQKNKPQPSKKPSILFEPPNQAFVSLSDHPTRTLQGPLTPTPMALLSLCVLALALRVSALPTGDFAPVTHNVITPPVIVDTPPPTPSPNRGGLPQLTPKIIGGVNAGNTYRWAGFSYVMNAAHNGFNGCGGSLIFDYSGSGCNSNADCESDEACRPFEATGAKRCQAGWYLSAAHCQVQGTFVVPNLYRVPYVRWNASQLNSPTPPQQRSSCNEVHVNPDYNPTIVVYDLAMCKLESPPDISVPLAALATAEQDQAFTSSGNILRTIGWGLNAAGTIPNDLQELDLRVVDNTVCQSKMPNVRGTQICAGGNISGSFGKDICSGDSGGPIFFNPPPLSQYLSASTNPIVLGITSYGYGCVSGYPGVWTRVASYRDWIINSQTCSRLSKTQDCNTIPGCKLMTRASDSSSTCQAISVVTPTGTAAVKPTTPPTPPPTTPARSPALPPTARRATTPTVPTAPPSVVLNAGSPVTATLVVRTSIALNLTKFRSDLAPLIGATLKQVSVLSSDSLVRTGIPMMELRISVVTTAALLDTVTSRLSSGNVLVSQASYDVRASRLGLDKDYDCEDNLNWQSAYGTECWSYYEGQANFGKCLAHGAATQSLATRGPCPRACGECFPRVCKDSTALVSGFSCENYAPNGALNSQCSRDDIAAACPAACEICIPLRCMDDPSYTCSLYGPGVSPADPLYAGFGRPSPLSPSEAFSTKGRLISCNDQDAAFHCPQTCGVCTCRDNRAGEWRGRLGQCSSYSTTPLPCYQSGVLKQCPVTCSYCLQNTPASCGAKSSYCSRPTDCCSSQCFSGSCQCSAVGAVCITDADCCASPSKGVCGKEGRCQSCRAVQDRCERDTDCCSGSCSDLSVCVTAL